MMMMMMHVYCLGYLLLQEIHPLNACSPDFLHAIPFGHAIAFLGTSSIDMWYS